MTPDDAIEEENNLKEKTFSQEVKETVNEIKKTTVESGTAVIDTVKKTVKDNTNKIVDKIENSTSQIPEESANIENTNTEASKIADETKEGN